VHDPPVTCASCGTTNAPGASTCAGCGRPLGAEAAASEPPPPDGGPTSPDAPPPAGSYPPPGGAPPPPPPGSAPPPAGSGPAPGRPPPPPPPPGGFGPPSGPGGTGGFPAAPGRPSGSGRSTFLLVLAIVVVVALVGTAVYLVATSGDDGDTEVVLEPIDRVQEDDFAGNLDVGEQAGAVFTDLVVTDEVPDPRVEQVDTHLAGSVVTGSDPAIFGGSRDTQVCDVEQLIDFLTDEANADKAEAWAEVLDIEVDEIETYVRGLTAVRLRWDTRVTNHGYRDGEARPFQSLLQAGTAVLVDDTGVPRVKCNCGNPLLPPEPLEGGSDGALEVEEVAQNPDDAWPGLDPAEAVAITPGDTVEEFVIVDVDDGGLIERPVGSDGANMRDLGTGDVQITLEWSSTADLDLHVHEPSGHEIYFGDRGPSPSGGELDVDSNVNCMDDGVDGGVENVYWPSGEAPSGTYTVEVHGWAVGRGDCGSGEYTLTITVDGETEVHTGSVVEDQSATYDFTVG